MVFCELLQKVAHMPANASAPCPSSYAPGAHVLLDMWGVQPALLEDETAIAATLRRAAEHCGATVLDIRLHHFGDGYGVTGVALLAESHITIHSWPETGFAALDIFMCGECEAKNAVAPLLADFSPQKHQVTSYLRGAIKPT